LTIKTCFSCGTRFQTNFTTVNKCNVCLQTDAIKKSMKNSSEDTYSSYDKQYHESWALLNRRFANARIMQEKAEQYRIQQEINEAAISNSDAFEHGQNFVNNPKFEITLGEDLLRTWGCDNPYVTERLRASFKLGLDTRVRAEQQYDKEAAWNSLKQQAYQAGIEHASKKPAPKFRLNSRVRFNNSPIKTKWYTSDLSIEVDEFDGTLTATWGKIFDKTELNELYKKGIEEGLEKLNTPELKQQRLLQKQEENKQLLLKKRYNLLSDIFKTLVFSLPLFMFGVLWAASTGWWTLLSIVFCFWAWRTLKKEYHIWYDANKQYLTG
jgi:hypothetical protein